MNIRKYLAAFVFAILCSVSYVVNAAPYTVETLPNVHVTDKTRYVSNPDGIFSPQGEAAMNAVVGDIWTKTSAEVVVVAVRSIGEADVNDFSTSLFEKWGIGKKDKSNGVLVLLVEDQHRAVIRTGYGAEGVLPDVLCGRIIRDVMAPAFRKGDYDGGMLNALKQINVLFTNPEAAAELKSKYANDAVRADGDGSFWNLYLLLAKILAVVAICYVLGILISTRRSEAFNRYLRLDQAKLPMLVVTFLTLGMALPAFLIVIWAMWRCRNKRRKCPNCHAKMHKLSEEEDNKYLTPAQDLEERLKSVDYDVWRCDHCGEVDIYPFINKNTPYQECPVCHAKALMLVSDRLIVQPTISHAGRGVKTYRCRNCGNQTNVTYTVPQDDVPVIVPFVGGFGSGRGGGDFGGGSFGGGLTGGGGASGDW